MWDFETYRNQQQANRKFIGEVYEEFCGYAVDGPISPETWGRRKIKVLYIGKETYGHDADCEIMGRPENFSCSIFNRNISKLSYSIHYFFDNTKRSDCYKLKTNKKLFPFIDHIWDLLQSLSKEKLQQSYSNVAVIQVKKTSGTTQSNDAEIRRHSRENAAWLSEQVRLISPDIVVCSGLVTWQALVEDIGLVAKGKMVTNETGAFKYENMVFVNSYHFSAWAHFNLYDTMFDLMKCITTRASRDSSFAHAWR
jgi:uracil-DNA glycosylase